MKKCLSRVDVTYGVHTTNSWRENIKELKNNIQSTLLGNKICRKSEVRNIFYNKIKLSVLAHSYKGRGESHSQFTFQG